MKEPIFDIFAGEFESGSWVDAVEGLSNARGRMEQIAAEKPGKYFLFSCTSQAVVARIETFHNPAAARKATAS